MTATEPATLAFVDVETTGVEAARHSMWEAAVILRRPDRHESDVEFAWQFAVDLSTADPAALRVNRYYERSQLIGYRPGDDANAWLLTDPLDGDLPEQSTARRRVGRLVADELARMLNGAVLVAANVAFDAAFLDRFLRANGQAPAWNYHLLEVESYAAGAAGLEPPWKLDQLLSRYDVKDAEEDRHTALGDARRVRDLYDAAQWAAIKPKAKV